MLLLFKLLVFSIYVLSAYCLLPDDKDSFKANDDCKELYQFFRKYGEINVPGCCNTTNPYHFIRCENDHVVDITLRPEVEGIMFDLNRFPMLEELNNLVMEGIALNDSVMPAKLFKLPKLESIEISSIDLHEIEEIESCHLKSLNFYETEFNEFPSQILKCSDLTSLDLTYNENITYIPKEIYNLTMKDFDLDNIKDLSIEIHKFAEPVDICDFRNINVKCYEKGACKEFVIKENPERYTVQEDYRYPLCEEVSTPKEDKDKKPSTKNNIITWIIVAAIIIALILNIIIFCCHKKIKNNKKGKEDDANVANLTPFPNNKVLSNSVMESESLLTSKVSQKQNSYSRGSSGDRSHNSNGDRSHSSNGDRSHSSHRVISPILENKAAMVAPTLISEAYTNAPTDMNVILHQNRDFPVDVNNSYSSLPSEANNSLSHIIVNNSFNNSIPIGNTSFSSTKRYNDKRNQRGVEVPHYSTSRSNNMSRQLQNPDLSRSSINTSKSSINNSSTYVGNTSATYLNKLYQYNTSNVKNHKNQLSNGTQKLRINNSLNNDNSATIYNESR